MPKSLENKYTIKVHTCTHKHTQQTSGNYFGLQTRINLMFKQSDKITIWKLLGLLFSFIWLTTMRYWSLAALPNELINKIQKSIYMHIYIYILEFLWWEWHLERVLFFHWRWRLIKWCQTFPWSHTLIFFLKVWCALRTINQTKLFSLLQGNRHPEFWF